jgi:chromosomal replication initiation ATPase DnaA
MNPRLKACLDAACYASGAEPDDVAEKLRGKTLDDTRLVYYLLAREREFSLSEIGRGVGGRGHGTVMRGITSAKNRAQTSIHFGWLLAKARKQLEAEGASTKPIATESAEDQ